MRTRECAEESGCESLSTILWVFLMHAQLLTDVPALLLNQPIVIYKSLQKTISAKMLNVSKLVTMNWETTCNILFTM